MRRFILAALLASIPVAAGAEPLCRDLKGLFTPCPPGTHSAGEWKRHDRSADAAGDPTRPHDPARSLKPAKPPLVGRGKLCRDSKGLSKPC